MRSDGSQRTDVSVESALFETRRELPYLLDREPLQPVVAHRLRDLRRLMPVPATPAPRRRALLNVGIPVSIGAKSLETDESLADLGFATPVKRHTSAVLEEVSILSPGVVPAYRGAKVIRITERGTALDRMRERERQRERAEAKPKACVSAAPASAWPPGTIVRDLPDGSQEITYTRGAPLIDRRNIGKVLGVR